MVFVRAESERVIIFALDPGIVMFGIFFWEGRSSGMSIKDSINGT